jgi:hypothetical protein
MPSAKASRARTPRQQNFIVTGARALCSTIPCAPWHTGCRTYRLVVYIDLLSGAPKQK